MVDELGLTGAERRIAMDLHQRGYAVLDFPDEQLGARIDRIKSSLADRFAGQSNDAEPSAEHSVGRAQDAWTFDPDVRAIACNRQILVLLAKLYGRSPFPFQTLNFPIGTEQHLHSDSIHFSSIPERFMCGVWLAFEDVHAGAGPLTYVPGSHKWPILSNTMIGRRGFGAERDLAQSPFETAWEALTQVCGQQQETFLARKGQALIWAANLLHGGNARNNPERTRWSQVTHYYFDDCIYYTPAYSDEPLGRLDLRAIVDIETDELKPNVYLGEEVGQKPQPPSLLTRLKDWIKLGSDLPADFSAEGYYRLNPDVAATGVDPAAHYRSHGRSEGRRYKYR